MTNFYFSPDADDQPLLVHRCNPNAVLPTRFSQQAAGYDLAACIYPHDPVEIEPGQRALVPTGLALAIPVGCYGRIAPRSGLAVNHGLDVLAGVVDSDYRGEIMVALLNTDQQRSFKIKHGDRIGQLILERIMLTTVREVEEQWDLPRSIRGTAGWGSTGVCQETRESV